MQTARVNREEGGDDVKSSWPLRPGLHTYYNGAHKDDVKSSWPLHLGLHTYYNGTHKGQRYREVEPIPKNVSQSGLQSATRLHEVGIASNSRSAYSGECVPGPCQHARVNAFPGLVHTARHTTKVGFTRSRRANQQWRQPSTVGPMIGVKS